jgi:hypothetical protein
VVKDKMHKGNYKKQENKVHMINEAGESVGVLFDTTILSAKTSNFTA